MRSRTGISRLSASRRPWGNGGWRVRSLPHFYSPKVEALHQGQAGRRSQGFYLPRPQSACAAAGHLSCSRIFSIANAMTNSMATLSLLLAAKIHGTEAGVEAAEAADAAWRRAVTHSYLSEYCSLMMGRSLNRAISPPAKDPPHTGKTRSGSYHRYGAQAKFLCPSSHNRECSPGWSRTCESLAA